MSQRFAAYALQVAEVVEVRGPGRNLLELASQRDGVDVRVEQLVDQISQIIGRLRRVAVYVEHLLLTLIAAWEEHDRGTGRQPLRG